MSFEYKEVELDLEFIPNRNIEVDSKGNCVAFDHLGHFVNAYVATGIFDSLSVRIKPENVKLIKEDVEDELKRISPLIRELRTLYAKRFAPQTLTYSKEKLFEGTSNEEFTFRVYDSSEDIFRTLTTLKQIKKKWINPNLYNLYDLEVAVSNEKYNGFVERDSLFKAVSDAIKIYNLSDEIKKLR